MVVVTNRAEIAERRGEDGTAWGGWDGAKMVVVTNRAEIAERREEDGAAWGMKERRGEDGAAWGWLWPQIESK